MRRQTHNRVEASCDALHFCHAEPFLYAVAAGFIKRFEIFDIIFDFLIAEI